MTADVQVIKDNFQKFETRLEKVVESFKTEMNKVRAGRANPHLLDKIVVDYYGTPTPLNQMANISVPEARLITISLWDASALKNVTKAIMASDLGITPTDDGKIIRLAFPQLTEERRKDLVKSVKKTAEEFKVGIRNERRDILEVFKKLKKDAGMTEDELATQEKEVQKATDKYIAALEKVLADKEKEILDI